MKNHNMIEERIKATTLSTIMNSYLNLNNISIKSTIIPYILNLHDQSEAAEGPKELRKN